MTMQFLDDNQSSSISPPRRSIVIDQNGQCMSITDELIELLGDLHGRILESYDDEQHGTTMRRSSQSLLRAEDGARIPNAGLYPALQWLAQERGYDLHQRVTPSLSVLPAPSRVDWLLHPDFIQFIGEKSLGQIGIHQGIKIELLLADLVQAFPVASIIVLGEHLRQLNKLAERLKERDIAAVSISSSNSSQWANRDFEHAFPPVVCSTPRAAADLDLAGADIVIVLDGASCQHEGMNLALSQVDARFKLFGLFRIDRSYPPSSVDAMLATFGTDVIRLQELGHARRLVNYAMVRTPHPRVDLKRDDPEFSVRCYWHHARRNRRIRRLAAALHAGEGLDEGEFSEVAAAIGRSGNPKPTVTILVERPIHAIEFAKSLPDWPLIATKDDFHRYSGTYRHRAQRNRCSWQTGAHQIVTVDAASTWWGDGTDVVIWAGGGQNADFLPHKWLRTDFGDERRLLIVDFDDRHNADAAEMSQQRTHAYQGKDVFPLSLPIDQGRLAMFLVRQPREPHDD